MGREKNKNGSLHKDGTFYTDEWWAESEERWRNLGIEGKKNKKDVTLCTDEWQAESETEVEKIQAERGRKKLKK